MKIKYISETLLTNKSAYTHHVLKMCDAFSKKSDVCLLIPMIDKRINFTKIKKDFLLTSKKNFLIKDILNFKLSNFIYRILFGFKVAKDIKKTLKNKKTIFFAGNGGSAADCEHLAGELVGRYKKNRKPYKAISLTTDTSVLTCIANDFGYEKC